MNIIGDVRGRSCILVDDLVDTAGTLCQAAQALKDEGAARVIAYITHPVLSGKAVERSASSALDQLVVTDTIPLGEAARNCKRIRVLSVAECWPRRCGGSGTRSPSVRCTWIRRGSPFRRQSPGGPAAPQSDCRCLVAGRRFTDGELK